MGQNSPFYTQNTFLLLSTWKIQEHNLANVLIKYHLVKPNTVMEIGVSNIVDKIPSAAW